MSPLLSPSVAFLLVWAIVLVTRLSVTDATFRRITGSTRHESVTSVTFFGLAIAAFLLGALFAPRLFALSRPARVPALAIRGHDLELIRRAGNIAAGVGALITVGTLLLGMGRAGGPGAILSALFGGSTTRVSDALQSARIQGLTVWVHVSFACATLGTLGALIARYRGLPTRPYKRIFVVGLVVALLNGLLLDERLDVFEYIVAAFVTAAGFHALRGARLLNGPRLVRGLALLALLVAVWQIGEYRRTYVARYGPNVENVPTNHPSASRLGFDQFAAYVLSSPNNGMYAVDHYRSQTYAFWSLNGLMTTFLLDSKETPVIGNGLAEIDQTLQTIYYPNGPFTTFSLPGYAFLDLSWAGLGVLFWFGVMCGVVHRRFVAGETWAVLIYPFVFVGVIDSYRTMYWMQSRVLVPVVLIALTCRALAGRRATMGAGTALEAKAA
jgi:oligosaccharide repeat unit polymerase